jgi:hypothetical protein
MKLECAWVLAFAVIAASEYDLWHRLVPIPSTSGAGLWLSSENGPQTLAHAGILRLDVPSRGFSSVFFPTKVDDTWPHRTLILRGTYRDFVWEVEHFEESLALSGTSSSQYNSTIFYISFSSGGGLLVDLEPVLQRKRLDLLSGFKFVDNTPSDGSSESMPEQLLVLRRGVDPQPVITAYLDKSLLLTRRLRGETIPKPGLETSTEAAAMRAQMLDFVAQNIVQVHIMCPPTVFHHFLLV